MFCSATCRQRDYEARKGLRARPGAAPRPPARNSVPRRFGRLLVTSYKRPIFQPKDVKALFHECRRVRRQNEADFDKIANDLDFIAQECISACRRRMAPTPGEDQKWLLGIASQAKRLLAAFGVNNLIDQPDNNSVYLLGIPSDAPRHREDLYLRSKMAAEVGAAEVPDTSPAIRGALRGLQMIRVRAECAADIAGRGKGAARMAPPEELSLVARLHEVFANVTGDKRWHTINPQTGIPGGPFVRFVQAGAAHIRDNLDAVESPVPAALATNLTALSMSPGRIADRIRLVRKILKARTARDLHG
jgi:hypothetical protein